MCTKEHSKFHSTTSKRRYSKKWDNEFSWQECDGNCQGAFYKFCSKSGKTLQRTGGVWITKPFTNWKKATKEMKAHEKMTSIFKLVLLI